MKNLRLKQLRKEKKLTQKQLAELFFVTPRAIRKWENQEVEISQTKLRALADFFKVTPAYLLGETNIKAIPKPALFKESKTTPKVEFYEIYNELDEARQEKILSIAKQELENQQSENYNIISHDFSVDEETSEYIYFEDRVSAGVGNYILDEQKATIELPTRVVPRRTDFVLSVDGDSMENEIFDGDYIFIQQTFDINENEIGVFILNNDTFVKQLVNQKGRIILHSLNSKYADILIEESDTFIPVGKYLGRYNPDDEDKESP